MFYHCFRKQLGKIRRKAFKTNHALWFCKHISPEDGSIFNSVDNELITIDCHNFSEAVQWIEKQSKQFPWIYDPIEIDYAKRYDHFYPLIIYDGNIAGYIKIALTKVYIEDYEDEIALEENEAFIYDTFILSELRKRYLGQSLLKGAIAELANKHYSFVFCHIPELNQASLKLYQNAGFKQISHVRHLRLFGFRYFSHKLQAIKEKGTLISHI